MDFDVVAVMVVASFVGGMFGGAITVRVLEARERRRRK